MSTWVGETLDRLRQWKEISQYSISKDSSKVVKSWMKAF